MFLENISSSNKTTMSSREIAQLCEKQHGHVYRGIEKLNETYESLGLSKVGGGVIPTQIQVIKNTESFYLLKNSV